jgi:hypothetical protein
MKRLPKSAEQRLAEVRAKLQAEAIRYRKKAEEVEESNPARAFLLAERSLCLIHFGVSEFGEDFEGDKEAPCAALLCSLESLWLIKEEAAKAERERIAGLLSSVLQTKEEGR